MQLSVDAVIDAVVGVCNFSFKLFALTNVLNNYWIGSDMVNTSAIEFIKSSCDIIYFFDD